MSGQCPARADGLEHVQDLLRFPAGDCVYCWQAVDFAEPREPGYGGPRQPQGHRDGPGRGGLTSTQEGDMKLLRWLNRERGLD